MQNASHQSCSIKKNAVNVQCCGKMHNATAKEKFHGMRCNAATNTAVQRKMLPHNVKLRCQCCSMHYSCQMMGWHMHNTMAWRKVLQHKEKCCSMKKKYHGLKSNAEPPRAKQRGMSLAVQRVLPRNGNVNGNGNVKPPLKSCSLYQKDNVKLEVFKFPFVDHFSFLPRVLVCWTSEIFSGGWLTVAHCGWLFFKGWA